MLHTGQQDSKQQAENPDERFAQCRFLSTRCASRNGGWVFPSKRSCTGHLITVGKLFRQARDKAGLPKELVFSIAAGTITGLACFAKLEIWRQ